MTTQPEPPARAAEGRRRTLDTEPEHTRAEEANVRLDIGPVSIQIYDRRMEHDRTSLDHRAPPLPVYR